VLDQSSGVSFSTALSLAAVTTGGTAGTTSPTSNCAVYVQCS
jgi:hypothetical protein